MTRRLQVGASRAVRSLLAFSLVLALFVSARGDEVVLDLADLVPGVDPFTRLLGLDSDGVTLGTTGVPVAAGFDLDGDGFEEFAISHYLRSPLGRSLAGEVTVVFGNGTIGELLDLESSSPRFLRIYGAGSLGAQEMTGSEMWAGDVTGDGIGDLLLCRQNYSIAGRVGAGAVTIVVGSPSLRDLATAGTPIDLANPPAGVTLFTIVGRHAFARLGIWIRTGDVDGDSVTDFVVGADQEDGSGNHSGAVYVVRGGPHLGASGEADLANYGSTSLVGNIARIAPPPGSAEYHFGGTCQLGDLDGNGRAEVMAAAIINRAGASIGPFDSSHGSGGVGSGRFYCVWDDAFPPVPWPAGFEIGLGTVAASSLTTISGDSTENDAFGEEILGGLDYSGDGLAELFIGDLTGDGFGGTRTNSGIGYVIYQAATVKGLTFSIDDPPPGIAVTTIVGPESQAIGSDTAGHGDLNADGIADLIIGNPKADPQGRSRAGTLSILLGRSTPWPALIDTAPGSIPAGVDAIEVQGARGTEPGDLGDTMGYSAALGDLDNDGVADLVVNEMLGNGSGVDAVDSGNLVILPGTLLAGGFTPAPVSFVRGDANQDGGYNIADAIATLGHLFESLPTGCEAAIDANDDDALDIADAIFTLGALFSFGPLPSAPHPGCGLDPTPGSLDCTVFAGCP